LISQAGTYVSWPAADENARTAEVGEVGDTAGKAEATDRTDAAACLAALRERVEAMLSPF